MLCVGYNDDDPSNSYWIMVNSWGTAEGGRPNGIFHLDMDMDYGCTFYDGGPKKSYYWEILDVSFYIDGQVIYVERTGHCGGKYPCYATIQEAVNAAGSGSTIKIAGGSYNEDVTLNTDKDLTFKGGYNSTFSNRFSETNLRTMTISNGTAVVDRLTLESTVAPDVASAVFYNNLLCGVNPFTATLTIDGQVLTSVSGELSNCEEFDCGVSLDWNLYANTGGCGIITGQGSTTFNCDCLYEYVLSLYGGQPAVFVYEYCPGDCSDVTSDVPVTVTSSHSVVLMKGGDLSGLTVYKPLTSK